MTTILQDDAPNEALMIVELFAFISLDDPGNEGICGAISPALAPMITSKERVAEKLKDQAREIARLSGKAVRLVRFTRAEKIWSTEQ
jgi:hypothetical protein